MKQSVIKRIDELIREMSDRQFAAGGNLLILRDGREEGYFESGVLDLESRKPVRRDSIFRCYSMSKPVTSFAVMKLLEEGRLELMDPVWKFLPGFMDQKVGDGLEPVLRDVQVKDMLSMTSGLTYGGNTCRNEIETEALIEEMKAKLYTPDEITTNEFANRLGRIPLKFQPGSQWSYGLSADVLGAIVETVSGMSYREYLIKNLFEPLGMCDTDFYVPEGKQQRLAKVYQPAENGLKLFEVPHLDIINRMDHIPAFQSGGAGLASTIDDYARFAAMLMQEGTFEGRQYLAPGTVRFMRSGCLLPHQQATYSWNGLEGYTYGNLMRVRVNDGQSMMLGTVGEYGWDGWLGTYFSNDPAKKLSIIFMIQKTDAGTSEYIRKIKNVIYGAEL